LAAKTDESIKLKPMKFKPGQEVIILSGGKPDNGGWRVKGFFRGEVLVTNNRETRRYSEDRLREYQEAPSNALEISLQKLKPFFGSDNVKVKFNGEVMTGSFGGVRSNGNFYVDLNTGENIKNSEGGDLVDKEGKTYQKLHRIELTDTDEFLSWQRLKTAEEILKDQEERLEPYIGMEYPSYKGDGTVITIKVEYVKDDQKVQLVSEEGVQNEYSIEEFLDDVLAGLEKLKRIEREFPKTERKFDLGQIVKGMTSGGPTEGWLVEDFSRPIDGKIWVTISKDDSSMSVEQDNLLSWQNSAESTGEDGGTPPDNTSGDNKKGEEFTDKEKARLKPLKKKLEALHKKKIRKSLLERGQSKWSDYRNKFEQGETAKERKLNKRRKRTRQIIGGVALAPLFATEVAVAVPSYIALQGENYVQNQRRRNLKNNIAELEVRIRDEEEQLRHEKKKVDGQQNVGS
jgi:hypothetical protein